jgi:hypothetical protein
MEPIEGSETSAISNQTPGKHTKENILAIKILLQWFDSNLPDYFGPTIIDLGRYAIGRAPAPVNAAGTWSFRQTTACVKRLCDRDSHPSVAWDDVYAIVLPLHRSERECLLHNGQVFRSSSDNSGYTSAIHDINQYQEMLF